MSHTIYPASILLILSQEICLPIYITYSYSIHSAWDNVHHFTDYQTKISDRLFEISFFCSQHKKNAQHARNLHLNCQQIRLPIWYCFSSHWNYLWVCGRCISCCLSSERLLSNEELMRNWCGLQQSPKRWADHEWLVEKHVKNQLHQNISLVPAPCKTGSEMSACTNLRIFGARIYSAFLQLKSWKTGYLVGGEAPIFLWLLGEHFDRLPQKSKERHNRIKHM